MNSLQKALTTNAIFSSCSGLIMLFFRTPLAQLFGLEAALPFLIIGIALLIFAFSILVEIKWQRPKLVYNIIVQDLLWVLGSIILLLWQPFGISTTGNILIAIVAGVVLIFAVWQYQALLQLTSKDELL